MSLYHHNFILSFSRPSLPEFSDTFQQAGFMTIYHSALTRGTWTVSDVWLLCWAVWRATVTWSQGQAGLGPVCGTHLMGARVPRLGLQKTDISRCLSQRRQCCVWSFWEPHFPSLSVPIPLDGPVMGGQRGHRCLQCCWVNASMLEEKRHNSQHPFR